MIDVLAQRAAIDASTEQLLVGVRHLDSGVAAGPSLLPGWNRAMVLTHLARNADGVRAMIEAATQGRVGSMYPAGRPGRDADIAAGRDRTAEQLLADLRTATTRLRAACGRLAPDQWRAQGETLLGPVPLWVALVSRRREVEVHHADLDLGYGFADWPQEFVVSELDGAVDGLATRLAPGVDLRLLATDGTGRWHAVGAPGAGATRTGSGGQFVIRAPGWALLAWLLGRAPAPGAAPAPALAPWGR